MKKILLVFATFSLCANLPDAYKELKELLPFFYINASQIQNLFWEIKPKAVIELGSWLGASTRHMAQLLPESGVVYAVDHWLGSVEHHKNRIFHKYLPTLYEQFLSNVIHAGLTHKIFPIRMNTLDAVKIFQDENI